MQAAVVVVGGGRRQGRMDNGILNMKSSVIEFEDDFVWSEACSPALPSRLTCGNLLLRLAPLSSSGMKFGSILPCPKA